jgi:chromosome segregation ATPase
MSTKNVDDLIVMLARRARAARRKAQEVEAYHRGQVSQAKQGDQATRAVVSQLEETLERVLGQRDRHRHELADARAEASRLAQELEAARLAVQDANERAQARERERVEASRAYQAQRDDLLREVERLAKRERGDDRLRAERDEARLQRDQAHAAIASIEAQRNEALRRVDWLDRARQESAREGTKACNERDEARAALAEALTRVEAREEEIRRLGNRVEAAERGRERDTEALVDAYEKAERERASEMRAVVVEHEAELQRLRREVEIRDAGIEMGVALVRYLDAGVDIVSSGRTVFPTHTQGAVYEALQRARQAHEADEAARAAHPLARGGS